MFKVLDDVCTPVRGTKYSAYIDLFARETVTIGAGETKIVKLGVKLDLDELFKKFYQTHKTLNEALEDLATNKSKQQPHQLIQSFDMDLKSHYLEVALRSSLAVKGLIIANGIGIIDLDYLNEIGLIIHNPISKKVVREELMKQKIQSEMGDLDRYVWDYGFVINKGDKVAQCTLKEHKGYLMGYKSEVLRTGGFGSTDKKEVHISSILDDLPDPFKCYKKI